MKCEICNKNIETTFMEKKLGTFVKDSKGKKHIICSECQKKFPDKAMILENIK